MSTLGIDGLASGLDTTSIINQLIALERQPITRLQGSVSANDAAISALNGFSTSFSAIKDLAKGLSGSASTSLAAKATSSAASVVATAGAGATTGSLAFTVDRLAATQRLVSDGVTASKDDVVATAGSLLTITAADGTATQVDVGDGTLTSIIAAVNDAPDLGVVAQAVNTGSGYKLQLSATSSGAAGAFTATGDFTGDFSTGLLELSAGADAQITVGAGTTAEYQITSASNTFTDVLEGLSFTVTAIETSAVTIDLSTDVDAVVGKVKAFVEKVNSVLGDIDASLASGAGGKPKGALVNDPSMRTLRDQLMAAVTYAVGGTALGSPGMIGIQSTRDGGLTFDESTFRTRLAEAPDDVVALFRSDDPAAPGLAQRVDALATRATESTTGTFATAITSRNSRNETLQSSIASYERRVELRRQTLQRQFNAMESALAATQAQGSWLTSQLASVNANWG